MGTTPVKWNDVGQPWHDKPKRVDHHLALKALEAYNALPQEERRGSLYQCDDCGGAVTWVTVKGRRVLCNVTNKVLSYYGAGGRGRGFRKRKYFFDPADRHQCQQG